MEENLTLNTLKKAKHYIHGRKPYIRYMKETLTLNTW
jgi:hypothetical protein